METKRSTSPHDFELKRNPAKSKGKKNKKFLISDENLLKKKLQVLKEKKEKLQKKTIDEKKMVQLQKLIDQGEYRINADELADKIIEKHLDNKNLKK